MTADEGKHDDGVLAAFLPLVLADIGRGGVRPVAEYQARFPGSEELIARELERLLAAEPDLGERAVVGRYRLIELIGQGGQAEVFRAIDTELDRPVAVKILPRFATQHARSRLRREAEVLSRIATPGICTIYETGVVGNRPFIAMQLVEGLTLETAIQRRRRGETSSLFDPPSASPAAERDRVLRLFEQLAAAVQDAHDHRIIHRDIKPDNVMIDPAGRPVVLDFGLAGLLDDQGGLTQPGDLFGTPAFMAPEQIAAKGRAVDHRADVWSLGVMLYLCLTGGRPPFTASTRDGLYRRILHDDPAPVLPRAGGDARQIGLVVETALQKDRDRRYQAAEALREDLERLRRRRPVLASPPTLAVRASSWLRREPVLAAALGVILLLTVVAAGSLVWLLRSTEVRARRESKLRREIEQVALERQRLLDSALLDYLPRWADELWPAEPRVVAAAHGMNDWLSACDELLGRIARGEASPDAKARPDRIEAVRRIRASVRARAETAERVRATSLVDSRAAWRDAAASVAADSRFQGLRLEPQLGLCPLGRDPVSKLWEFWHVASGERPAAGRRADAAAGLVFVLLPGRSTADCPWLSPFFVSKHEVTQAQWLRVMEDNPSASRPGIHERLSIDLTHPVENVTWRECAEYCRRSSLDLPTEEQWQHAAAGGSDLAYVWSAEAAGLEGRENVADRDLVEMRVVGSWGGLAADWRDGFASHAPVGSFAPNGFGLHDALGNVSEWCRDDFVLDPTRGRDEDGGVARQDPGASSSRAYRGGSWYVGPDLAAVTRRWRRSPDSRAANLGLRPVRPLK